MATTTIKVHPAIGIARLGNSPNEFFIGPETADEPPIPHNGYKDAQCRVKRQAARFRLYSYDENGAVIKEITSADADIVWKVELANRKGSGARFSGGGTRNASITGNNRDLLDIKPGEKAISGANEVVDLNGSFQVVPHGAMSVHLGQLRMDPEGHLLVLGGRGISASPTTTNVSSWSDNDTWHDDVSDGRVRATVTMHGTGEVFEAIAAWVIVAPPKFAPPIYNAITLYDTIYQFCRQLPPGHPAKVDLPPQCSFRRDIYPILQAAKDVHGVVNVGGAHSSINPDQYPLSLSQRALVFGFLRGPGGSQTMPKLQQSPPLTQTQYDQLTRWKDDAPSFVNDWDPALPPTPLTPDALDRGPLTHCVGATFFPGIEAGAFVTSSADIYMEPLRFDPNVVQPGDVTRRMALPWQADFKACGGASIPWWPVNRPTQVHPQTNPTGYEDWDVDIGSLTEMVSEWHQAGFVVRSGATLLLSEKCAAASVVLLTPELDFGDVQMNPLEQPGQMALPVTFEVQAPSSSVTLKIEGGPAPAAFSTLGATEVTVGPTGPVPAKVYLWILFTTGTLNQTVLGSVTVEQTGSSSSWTIPLIAKTVARQKTAVCLVLDRSGSMGEMSGSVTKMQALHQAAHLFLHTALAGDGVGLVSYNADAVAHGSSVTELDALGSFAGPREALSSIVNGLVPSGSTSIGDGLEQAVNMLSQSAGYARKATVVLTDGMENAPKFIRDVAGAVTSQTFAIGFGNASNINVSTLTTLTGNQGGYLLVTGPVTDDNQFLLKKYFLQVLAGVSNADIVLDPTGRVIAGQIHRIPFHLSEDDYGVDAILLCQPMRSVVLGLETPAGEILTFSDADGAALQMTRTEGHAVLRLRLPVLFTERAAHAGLWHVLFGMPARGQGPDVAASVVTHDAFPERIATRTGYVPSTRVTEQGGDKGLLISLMSAPKPDEAAQVQRERLQQRAALIAAERAQAAPPVVRPASPAAEPAPRAVELGPPYSVLVHVYSALKLRAELVQKDFEPGARVGIVARLSRVGVPFDGSAQIFAEVSPPQGVAVTVSLEARPDGHWEGEFVANEVGVYRVRVRATGTNVRHQPFTRELTLTASVARGANSYQPPASGEGSGGGGGSSGGGSPNPGGDHGREKLCASWLCMLENGLFSESFEKALQRIGINLDVARKCLRKHCQTGSSTAEVDTILRAFEQVFVATRDGESRGD